MRFGVRWLAIFSLGVSVIVAMLLMTLFTPAPYGDLSRIGRLSDADFGWQTPPPAVPGALIHSVPLDQADVLVVGDSFSMTLRWQSELVREGYKIATIYWGDTGPLCKDFTHWARRAGFRGKLVIVESVERLVGDRLVKSAACAEMPKDPVVKAAPYVEPLPAVPGFALNLNDKLTSGWVTFINAREARKVDGATLFGNGARVRPVKDGCRYFSHRLCDKALFFADDTVVSALKPADVDRMRAFITGRPGVAFLWMVIPDKTTVYIDHDHAAGFATALRESKLGPDLFSFAAEERERVRDLYFPNDTHLSMHGQLAVGKKMLEVVRQALPLARG